VGPLQYPLSSFSRQAPRRRRHRARRCLLKGCERWFQPVWPQARYCSDACQQAARRWRRRRASRHWRASEMGKARRRCQSERHRQRQRALRASAQLTDSAALPPRVGQRPAFPAPPVGHHRCARPGCYVCFVPRPHDPPQRFCSAACRQALRRVLDREERWRQRHGPCRGGMTSRFRPLRR
jgi:hypothetical protein